MFSMNFHSHPIKLVPDHVRDRRGLFHNSIVWLPLALQFIPTLVTLVIHWITHLEVDRFTAPICVLGLSLLSPFHVIMHQSEQFVLLLQGYLMLFLPHVLSPWLKDIVYGQHYVSVIH